MTLKFDIINAVRNNPDKVVHITISQLTWAISKFINIVHDDNVSLIVSKHDSPIAVIIPFDDYINKIINQKKQE